MRKGEYLYFTGIGLHHRGRWYFDNEKANGNFKNIDYAKFEEKYNEGMALDKIEEEIKKEQLPLE